MFAFFSEDPSSNTAEVFSFSCKMFEKNENKQKEAGVCPLKIFSIVLLINHLIITVVMQYFKLWLRI